MYYLQLNDPKDPQHGMLVGALPERTGSTYVRHLGRAQCFSTKLDAEKARCFNEITVDGAALLRSHL